MTSTIKVAVVGGGYFANFHINAWLRIAGVELVAIVEPDLTKHEALASKTNSLIIDSLSQTPSSVDIIDIVTPPATHSQLIDESIDRQCPLIICQKPFCGNLATAQKAVKKISASKSTVVVHENFRFQPWFRAIKTVLSQNTLGDVLQATFRLRPGDGQGANAYLERQPYFQEMEQFLIHETGVHYIDVFRFLFGEPDAVSADLRKINPVIAGEDAGHFVFHYSNGLRAHFDGNRLLDHGAENSRLTMGEMLIEGTLGCLSLNGNGDLKLRAFGQPDWRAVKYTYSDTDFGGDCVYHFQQHIVDHLQKNTALENSASDYMYNLTLESLVYLASETQSRQTTKH